MEATEIDFGSNPLPTLLQNGLKIPSLRGRLRIVSGTAFEAPTSVQPQLLFGYPLQIGAFCSISGTGSLENVQIGRYVSIASGVVVGTHEHPMDWLTSSRITYHPQLHDWHRFCAPDRVEEILANRCRFAGACPTTRIGNDVWIGNSVFIKSGVTIGDGAVIGARSVVTKDVPPYSIAVGSPAKVRRLRFSERTVERLMRLRWWRYSLYDLAGVSFDCVESAISQVEQRIADQDISPYQGRVWGPGDLKALFTPEAKPAA